MITLKIKYNTSEENKKLIEEYQRQYTICYKVIAKYIAKGCTKSEIKKKLKTYNNIKFILNNSWFMNCLFYDVKCLKGKIACFNKSLLLKRVKGLISKEEFKKQKLFQICSNGEKDKKCNRFFKLNEDLSILFKPNAKTHLLLNLQSIGKNRVKILNTLFKLQCLNNILPITYRLDANYIYLSYDETLIKNVKQVKSIESRIFSIDMNPNYIGYSVIDWKDTENLKFKIVNSGVISLKDLTDKHFNFKQSKLSSTDSKRTHLTNKRKFECFEVAKQLVTLAKHYRCEIFALEDLSIRSSDKSRGKKFNSLCNNLWNRNKLHQNILKRCNILGIKVHTVIPNWSSVLGNSLYRETNLPDMVLSSIEISRRCQEFNLQYYKNSKEPTKNIVFPKLTKKVKNKLFQTMEVLNNEFCFEKIIDYCKFLKKNFGNKYRVPLDESKVFRQKHLKYQLITFNKVLYV